MERLFEFVSNVKKWITEYKRDAVIFVFIFLVSLLSFGLGYLVNREFNRAPIIIEKCGEL